MSTENERMRMEILLRQQEEGTFLHFGTHETDEYGLVVRKVGADEWAELDWGMDNPEEYYTTYFLAGLMVDDPSPWSLG